MPTLIGKQAPSFNTKAVIEGKKIIDNYSLDQFIDKKYVVLFFTQKIFLEFVLLNYTIFKKKLMNLSQEV